jgi:tubulin-specific chaperone A
MAKKRISDEEIKLSIVINGNEAQKELYELEKNTREVTAANKELLAEKKKLERQGKQETAEYKKLTAEIKANNAVLRQNKSRMGELQNEIGLTGLTLAQLRTKANQLKLTLRNLIPGSADYNRYQAELKQVSARLDELNGKAKTAAWSVGNIADRFNRFAALGATVIAAGTGVVLTLQKMIDYNGKLADAQSNVMKTTGLTRKEVDELTKSFSQLRTRTSRIELLGIAEVGGRLGIAKEEIANFVKVMDKSAVALGDSFEGGPEVVAEKLGRIKGLYDELKNSNVESAFESVGSAMNDLGAAGTASEQNVAEFTTRVGALPAVLKPTIQEALGLGAAFEESGLKAEIAGTNYGKVISIAARDIGNFATVMRRPRKELEDLINNDPTEFFLQFASSLKGLDATELAQVLDYLKLNDNEVKMVLGAASQNVDMFREKIDLASESMAEATSLTDEYNIKNNNLAATLERIQKKVFGWFSSETVVQWLEDFVNGFAKLIGAVEDSEGTMNTLRNTLVFTAKILAIVAASFISYAAGAKLSTIWSNTLGKATAFSNLVFKIQYALLIANEIKTKALALAKALLTGNITRARAAYQALAVTMGLNPFGVLLGIIGAVIAAFALFRKEVDETSKILQQQAEIQKQVQEQTGRTKNRVADLVATLKDENATYDQKQRALEQLQKLGRGYLDTLTLENALTAEGDRLVKEYIKSIDKLAEAKAMVDVRSKLMAQKTESENKILALRNEKGATANEGLSDFFGGSDGKLFGIGSRNQKEIQSEIDEENERKRLIELQLNTINKNRTEELEKLSLRIKSGRQQLEKLKKNSDEYKKLLRDILNDEETFNILSGITDAADSALSVTGGDLFIPDPDAAQKVKQAAELHKKRMEDIKKQLEDIKGLSRKAIDERLELMEEGLDKEEALEAENHKRRIEDLKAQLTSEADIQAAEKKMLNQKLSVQERDYWSRQVQVWVSKNVHLNGLLQLEQARHQYKLATIRTKGEQDKLEKLQQAYEDETKLRQTKHNYELAALGDNEAKKAKLQQQFDKSELERQQKHLEKLLQAQLDVLADKNKKIDLTLLDKEQRQKIEQDIADLKLKISEIVKAKAELSGKGGTDDMANAFAKAFGDADVLGFTAQQWGQTFSSLDTLSEKLEATKLVIGAMQNVWGTFNDFVAVNENARLSSFERNAERKKRKLKWQLDNGYLDQVQYNREVERMDAELDVKRSEIEYRQAKRQKQISAMNIIWNTAQAIMGIWAQFPKADFGATAAIMAGVVGALGAVQLATVLKTPLPAKGYEQGLYPDYVKREQDGKLFRAGYGGKTRSGMVNKPTYFLTGENGPEMVIDNRAYRSLSAETRNALLRELRGIKGWENGYYSDQVKGQRFEVPASFTNTAPISNNQDADRALLIEVVRRNTEVMEKIYTDGIISYFSRDPRDLKKLMEDMERITRSKEKAKY